jgi:hypothetical protein
MSTRGSCSTVSQSQLVRGPSVRAHSTTVSHRAARYSAGGPERDVWRGAEGRIAVARVLEVSAGGRVPPSSSTVCFAGPQPGAASVERRCGRLGFHTICHRQDADSRTLERACTARPTRLPAAPPGLCKRRAPRAAPARASVQRRAVRAAAVPTCYTKFTHTHTEALIPFVCPQYVHTTLFIFTSTTCHRTTVSRPSIEDLIRKHVEHNSRVITRAGRRAPHATSSSTSPLPYSRP